MNVRIRKIAVPLLAMLGLGLLAAMGHADGIPPVSPLTPQAVLALGDGLHIVDNGSLLTLRDVKNGVWAAGTSTALYKQYYLSADGLLGYIPSSPGSNAFYGINGRFWAGQLLYDKVPFIKSLADSTYLTASLLEYGTVGYWGTRDFQYGLWRHGWDIGLTIKFGPSGQVTGISG